MRSPAHAGTRPRPTTAALLALLEPPRRDPVIVAVTEAGDVYFVGSGGTLLWRDTVPADPRDRRLSDRYEVIAGTCGPSKAAIAVVGDWQTYLILVDPSCLP